MTEETNSTSEITLLKDKEWSIIESELCLVADFLPLAGCTVKDGTVISPSTIVPYASVNVTCKKIQKKITGFICHKIDFLHLWSAFKERGIDEQEEEVLIYWTTKHYKDITSKLFSGFMKNLLGAIPLPKLVVMISQKDIYKTRTNSFKWPLEKDAIDFAIVLSSGTKKPNYWIPEVMK